MGWRLLWIAGVLVLAGCAVEESSSPRTAQAAPAPRPVAAPVSSEPLWPSNAPTIRARTAIMIDANTGRTLFEKYADTKTQVASTQKMVTALVVLESGNLGSVVTIQKPDTLVEPGKLYVKTGQTYTRMQLLTAMLVKSENDAAAALARDHSGSVQAFSLEMNQKARELGAYNSYFLNPHGLPAAQYSTARDMAKIAYRAYREPTLRHIVGMPYYNFAFSNGQTKLLKSTNKLLERSTIYNGMKTGFTNAAGRCLISSASYGGRDVILVQLGSKSQYIFDDAEAMMRWGLQMGSPFSPSSYLTSN